MNKSRNHVGIIGIPMNSSSDGKEASCLADSLRRLNIVNEIEDHGLKVHDYGDIELFERLDDTPIYFAKSPRTFCENSVKICKKLTAMMTEKNMTVVTLGGDHALATGTISGHSMTNKNVSVIWLDAYPDLHTPLSGFRRDINRMPLSFVVKELQNEMPWINEFGKLPMPKIPAKNLVYIGLRKMDPFEKHIIDKYNIKAYFSQDIDEKGIHCIIQEAMKAVNPNKDRYYHLSIDMKVFDRLYAPSIDNIEPGGLTLREVLYVCEQLSMTGKLNFVDISCTTSEQACYSDTMRSLNSIKRVILACVGVDRCGKAVLPPDYYSWKKLNPSRLEMMERMKKKGLTSQNCCGMLID